MLATLAVCREQGVALTSRGAGTSIAGNAVGPGVVVDFSRHLNRVLSIDPGQRTAVVEPGTILDAVNAAAAPHGLRFGPDPSTHARATVGGSLANNACGSRALGYGRSVDNVVSLDVATVDGARFTAARLQDAPIALREALQTVVRSRLAVIRTEFGRFTRQSSGYALEHLLPENHRDPANLARFLVGSEGTLAVTLGARIALTPRPKAVALAVLGYPDMPAAADAVPGLLPHRPVALEGLDSQLVEVVRRRRGAGALPPLPAGGGWLLVEVEGENESQARDAAVKLAADAGCLESTVVTGAQAAALWRIREDGAGLGSRTPANRPAWPGWEDAAVPPERLGSYLREFRELMDAHGVEGLVFGHFGDGCVHARIDFPLAARPDLFRAFVTEAARLVVRHDGSMSGEHGDGRARGELLPLMYSPAAIEAFRAAKHVFDPGNLLNPGIVVDPAPLTRDLRLAAAGPIPLRAPRLGFAYPHDGGDLSTAVHRCVGLGKCRAEPGTHGVMCPSYQATKDEKDSTRGRARVLQELANGALVGGFSAPEVAESLDLCLACKGCSSDCPAGVDMATYKAEALYQRYRRRLRPRAHYALGWLPRWARLTGRVPGAARIVNALLALPPVAAAAKRAGGIDHRRGLPRFAPITFRRWFARRAGAAAGPEAAARAARPPVLLWVDTFTDHFSPEVGRAAVRVLEDAGYAVELPEAAVCCGLTWISTGQLDGARRELRRTLDALEPALRAGTPIVGLEPSCLAVLRGDAVDLLPGDRRAVRARESVRTLAELLAGTEGWHAPDLTGVRGVAQPHCHHHAVLGWQADARLLAEAGAEITAVGGCCGLAGNFGVEQGHYEVSAAVAGAALLPAVAAAGDEDLVLADGFSCRTQLEHLSERRGIHLAQLLADRLGPGPAE